LQNPSISTGLPNKNCVKLLILRFCSAGNHPTLLWIEDKARGGVCAAKTVLLHLFAAAVRGCAWRLTCKTERGSSTNARGSAFHPPGFNHGTWSGVLAPDFQRHLRKSWSWVATWWVGWLTPHTHLWDWRSWMRRFWRH